MDRIVDLIVGTLGIVGFLIILGVAGNDCDGGCMENAMSTGDMIFWSGIGIGLMVTSLVIELTCRDV